MEMENQNLDESGDGRIPLGAELDKPDDKYYGWLILNINIDSQPLYMTDGSAYVFILCRNTFLIGPIFSIFIWLFQILMLSVYFHDFKHVTKETSVVKSLLAKKVAMFGAYIFLAIRTLPGIARGLIFFWIAWKQPKPPNPMAQRKYWKICVLGIFELSVSLLTIMIGVWATMSAMSVREFITEAVVATFIQYIDEGAHSILQFISSNKYYQRISDELIIDYGDTKGLTGGETRKLRNTVLKEDLSWNRVPFK